MDKFKDPGCAAFSFPEPNKDAGKLTAKAIKPEQGLFCHPALGGFMFTLAWFGLCAMLLCGKDAICMDGLL